MAIYRGPGGSGDATTDAQNEGTIASNKATEAAASATAAASSATAAATSAANAATSETNASTSASSAGSYASAAATSASNATTSETNASASASAAATSETNAATSESNASTSATNAATSATNASTSETNAASSATAAATSATSAATSATNASTSETNAASSATAAATSESNAATSEANAATLYDNFDDRYLGVKSSAPTVDNDGDALITGAVYWNSTTTTFYVWNGSAWVVTTDNASSIAAAASASAAATSESNAATSESNAATSATNAATSATNAATSETNAAASYDLFDDRYLGSKSSAPLVDNDGDALLTGALYWNSTGNQLYVWNGSAWDAAAFSASGAVTSFNTRTGAVTLSSADVTTALGFTPQNSATAVADIDDLSNVDTTTTAPTSGQVLKWNGSNWTPADDIDTTLSLGSASVNDLGDVTITSATSGQVLKYNGSAWINDTDSTGTTINSIDDINDVTITSVSSGQVLKYDGTKWINDTDAGGIALTDLSVTTNAVGTAALSYNNTSGVFSYTPPDLSSYLTSYTETDPVYTASSWYTTTNNSTNWNTAYGWGDHSTAGYLTSYTETDPVFVASPAYGITSTNITNWNTAYSWGDHASAGYLTSFTETNDLTSAVTWANVPDANITQSSVTQHQAALSITESQISDLGTYVTKTSSTGSGVLPAGTDAQRDVTPAAGYLRFNTTSTSFEGYDGSAWGSIGGGGGGGASAGGAIYENTDEITSSYTIAAGKNGHSVGPITIASGVAVTITSGQRWVVV